MPRSTGTALALPAYDLAVRHADSADGPSVPGHLRSLVARIRRFRGDFPAFCAETLKIRNKRGRVVPFVLNRAQLRVWNRDIWPKLEADKPVRLYVLKGRQLGFTTMFAAAAYWLTSLWADQQALMGSYAATEVQKTFLITKRYYRQAPPEFRPEQKRSNRAELYFANPSDKGDLGLESHLLVAPATINFGVSQTLSFVHLSEYALYDQRSLDVPSMMAALQQAIPHVARTFRIKETTARPGYAQDDWYATTDDAKVFIPWVADETYTEVLPLEESVLSADPESRYGDELEALEHVVRHLADWYPELAGDEKATRHEAHCRLAWRRRKIDESFKDGLALFMREYPLTPDEAFRTATSTVFDRAVLRVAERRAREAEAAGPPRRSVWLLDDWRVVPSAHIADLAEFDGLTVYENPRQGKAYLIGGDPGGGYADGDPGSLQILRRGDSHDGEGGKLFQVAVFHGRLIASEFARITARLGLRYNSALVIPEATGIGVGYVQALAHAERYPNLFSRVSHEGYADEVLEKWGFATTTATKPLLVAAGQEYLASGRLILRDLPTIEELLSYTADRLGRFGAPKGRHDDRVMALLFPIYADRMLGMPANRAPERRRRWWLEGPKILGHLSRREAPVAMPRMF